VEAAFCGGELLRTHVLRPTWHLVSPNDILWMLELTAPRIKSQTHARDLALGLTESDMENGSGILTQALRGGRHLLRTELAQALEDAGIDTSGYRLSHFLMRAELDGVVCSGAPRGKNQTYALLRERAPQAQRFDRETALAMLAARYFRSRGPATLKDFVWWSGLTTTESRHALDLASGALTSAAIGGQTYYFDPAVQTADVQPNTVHRLPAFDEYLIAYADRSAVISQDHIGEIISSNGIFRPAQLQDGIVVGTWKP
jgi:hypothetical protein